MRHTSTLGLSLLLGACFMAACSAPSSDLFNSGGSSTATVSAGGAGTTSTASSHGGSSHGGGGSGSTTTASTGSTGGTSTGSGSTTMCAAESYPAAQPPLDMFIMLDQSGSMEGMIAGGQTKWQALTGGLKTFFMQPGMNGLSVGIQYFGVAPGGMQCPTTCTTDADCGSTACGPCFFGTCFGGTSAADSCNASDYAKPDVAITALPGGVSALMASLAMHGPSTGTPTAPALQGAINYASQWSKLHPDHVTIAIFATDGIPGECSPTDTTSIAAIAAQGVVAGIKTFAVGVFEPADMPAGPNLMNAIAAQGGTGQAFIFDTNNPNVQSDFNKALNTIRGSALGCPYNIPAPPGGTVDVNEINVQYTPSGGAPIVMYHYPNAAACTSGYGWYYDDNAAPTRILLCAATCGTVSNDATGKIDILLGCPTQDAP